MASWTEDDIELLKKLTLEGYSASQIADRMPGRTRNSVISRWHREGLEVGKQPKKRKPRTSSLPVKPTTNFKYRHHVAAATSAHVRALRSLEAKMRYAETSKSMRDIDGIEPLNVELMDLHERSCRFAVTAELPHLFCGHVKQEGSSYCSFHHAICHQGIHSRRDQRPEPRRKAA